MVFSFLPGDKISMSDCIGTFRRNRLKEANNVFMVAAGTGKAILVEGMFVCYCIPNYVFFFLF